MLNNQDIRIPNHLQDMSEETFNLFRDLIYQVSGISLADSKKALLVNRINKRTRSLGIPTAEKYLQYVKSADSLEMEKLIDVVSTNVTYFFRETPHFDFLAKKCEEWKAQKKSKVRIWCAAASSGQEPYTIAMVLAEKVLPWQKDVRILGTDICSDVLLKAKRAIYSLSEIEGVPKNLEVKYFSRMSSDDGDVFSVSPVLTNLMTFKRLNLSQVPFAPNGPLDIIFCRNVMIYFDRIVRQKVINEFYRLLAPGGIMILSHSENLLGIEHSFKSLGNSIYQKV